MPTLTRCREFCGRAMPLPKLEVGRRAVRDRTAVRGEHGDLVVIEVNGVDGDQVGADDTQPAQPLQWAYAMELLALYDFVQRFMDMRVDGQVEFPGQRCDTLEAAVADGIGRVRCQCKMEERLAEHFIAGSQSFGEVVVGVGCVGGGKFQQGQPDHRPHPGLADRGSGGSREKIHVVEAGNAATQHLGTGEQGAVSTNSGETWRPSAGQMCSCSQVINGMSSARPRSRLIAAWQCRLTRPGIRACRSSVISRPAV